MKNLIIQQARVLDPNSRTDQIANVYIQEGKIAAIGDQSTVLENFHNAEKVNAAGLWLVPGAIDLAAWLREPGLDHKASLASETRAAVASGVTTLCYQPEPA
ncbi:MAG TPA: dihydroorotase, partial [Thiolinea sp.]|nr:dihydroorotase [Thiolinea sp.]